MIDSEGHLARIQTAFANHPNKDQLVNLSTKAVELLSSADAISIRWLPGSGIAGFQRFVFAEADRFRFVVTRHVQEGFKATIAPYGTLTETPNYWREPDYLRVRWIERGTTTQGHAQFHEDYTERPVILDEKFNTSGYLSQQWDRATDHPLTLVVPVFVNPEFGIRDPRLVEVTRALQTANVNKQQTERVYLYMAEEMMVEKWAPKD